MSARTEVVPFWWTTLDELGARIGTDVTPYKVPSSSLNDAGNWSGGRVVQIPLALSSDPASVARFFREGYEWVDLPEDVTSGSLIELFAELFSRDKLRFAHFDPLLVSATTALRDIARVKEALGSTMVAGADTATTFTSPPWLSALHAIQVTASAIARSPTLAPYEDLGRLHFDYWGNSEWRMAFLDPLFRTYPIPKTWDMNIMGIGAANPLVGLPAALPTGHGAGQELLAAIVPQALPLDAPFGGSKIRISKVLARKPIEGAAIRAVATPKGKPERPMNVVSVHPPLIELDGWSTQTLVPFYLNSWKLRDAKLSFRITIPLPCLSTIIEIVHQRRVIRREKHDMGSFLLPGVHTWQWDGFDDDGVYDTAILKSNELVARVTTTDAQGRVAVATTQLGTGPGTVRWLDTRVDTNMKTVDVSIFIRATKPSDHNFASFSFPLPKGTGAAMTRMLAAMGSDPGLSMVPLFPAITDQIPDGGVEELPPFLLGFPKSSVPRLLNDDRIALTAPFPKAFDLEQNLHASFKRELLFGIGERWSRTITLDGEPYELRAQVSERESDAFWIILAASLPKALDDMFGTGGAYIGPATGSRSFNLASFGEGLPILYIWDERQPPSITSQRDLGAHEFGHTVLRDAYDPLTSCCHKGTSDPVGTVSASAPTFAATPPPTTVLDLMLYYNLPKNVSVDANTLATDDDARALAWMAKVVFG